MEIFDKAATIERIKALSKEKGTSLTFMYKQLGFPSGYLRDVNANKSALTKERIFAIADYFGVSVEYLKGETDIKEKAAPLSESDLSFEDIEFLKAVDLLNPDFQRLMLAAAELDAEQLRSFADLAESFVRNKKQ